MMAYNSAGNSPKTLDVHLNELKRERRYLRKELHNALDQATINRLRASLVVVLREIAILEPDDDHAA